MSDASFIDVLFNEIYCSFFVWGFSKKKKKKKKHCSSGSDCRLIIYVPALSNREERIIQTCSSERTVKLNERTKKYTN